MGCVGRWMGDAMAMPELLWIHLPGYFALTQHSRPVDWDIHGHGRVVPPCAPLPAIMHYSVAVCSEA